MILSKRADIVMCNIIDLVNNSKLSRIQYAELMGITLSRLEKILSKDTSSLRFSDLEKICEFHKVKLSSLEIEGFYKKDAKGINITNSVSVVSKIVSNIKEKIDLTDIKLSNEFHYNSIVFCVIDAIYSINAKYSTTQNVVRRYAEYFNLQLFRERGSSEEETINEHTILDFLLNIENFTPEELAENILMNKQRTSTVNGILKAEAVIDYCNVLYNFGIDRMRDVSRNNNDELLKSLLKVKGQSSGVSTNYFYMLCNNKNLVKPDRHIINFLYQSTGIRYKDFEVISLFNDIVIEINKTHKGISIRDLDHAIWKYMSRSE